MFNGYTIHDVAALSGVSIATVSRVLNSSAKVRESTRDAVLSAVQTLEDKHNNTVISAVRKPKDKIILACFPELRNPFYANVFKGISEVAAAHDYKVLFYQNENFASKEYYSFLLNSGSFSGLIIGHAVPDSSVLDLLAQKTPVVMCAEHNASDTTPFVAIDDFKAASTAMNFLIATGRRKIALINSSLRNNYATHRERAYYYCMNQHGLEVNPDWVVHLSDVNYALGLTAVNHILRSADRPDALFCVSDVYAAAAINSATQLGIRVPQDVAVFGFDNTDISTMTIPPITTISQPTYELGAQACNILIEQIEYPGFAPKQVILETELILRGST